MQKLVNRLLASFATHLLSSLLVIGMTYLMTNDFNDASLELRASVSSLDPILGEQSIRAALGETSSAISAWVIWSLVVSLLASIIFLTYAERSLPANDNDARKKRGIWAALLASTLIACGIFWWRLVSIALVATNISGGSIISLIVLGFLAVLLSFYLSTALFVKITMKPAVPLADILPGMR